MYTLQTETVKNMTDANYQLFSYVLIFLYLIHFMKSEAIMVLRLSKSHKMANIIFYAFQCFKALFVNVKSIYHVLTLYPLGQIQPSTAVALPPPVVRFTAHSRLTSAILNTRMSKLLRTRFIVNSWYPIHHRDPCNTVSPVWKST